MYVLKTDYIGRITMSLLDILLAEDSDTILADVSKEAEDTIATMCGGLYDIMPELSLTGSARNGYILGIAKNIALYYIYQRADDESIPEKIIKNYDDAMHDLTKISTGKQILNLPPKPADKTEEVDPTVENAGTNGNGLRRIGSALKRTHHI